MLIIYQCYVDGNNTVILIHYFTYVLTRYWNFGYVTTFKDFLLITQNIECDKATLCVLIRVVPRPTAYYAFNYLTNQKNSNSSADFILLMLIEKKLCSYI